MPTRNFQRAKASSVKKAMKRIRDQVAVAYLHVAAVWGGQQCKKKNYRPRIKLADVHAHIFTRCSGLGLGIDLVISCIMHLHVHVR